MPARRLLLAAVLALLPLLALGAAKKEPEVNPRGFEYIALAPPFVVNFGSEGRVGFLKAEVSLRVASPAVAAVNLHMPAIRHELIMLLSRQSPEDLAAPDKREPLRTSALEAVRALLVAGGGVEAEQLQDLLFTSFLTQR